jgi:hypothetical protein
MFQSNVLLLGWQVGWVQQDRMRQATVARMAALARQKAQPKRWRNQAAVRTRFFSNNA